MANRYNFLAIFHFPANSRLHISKFSDNYTIFMRKLQKLVFTILILYDIKRFDFHRGGPMNEFIENRF